MMKKLFRMGCILLLIGLLTGCKVIKEYSHGTYEDVNLASNQRGQEDQKKNTDPQDNSSSDEEDSSQTSETVQNREQKEDQPSTSQKESKNSEEKVDEKAEEDQKETEPKDKEKEEEPSEPKDEKEDQVDSKKEESGAKDSSKEEKDEVSETGKDKVEPKEVKPREGRKEVIQYEGKSNESLSWWYRPAKETGKGIPATINDDIAQMLDAVGGLWQVPNGQKKIYLTFDEGYEYKENTTAILNILKEKSVEACFFITGHFIQSRPDLVKRMVAEGHVVANHTIHHYAQPEALTKGLLIEDITGLEKAFEDLTGKTMAPFMRPPAGAYSEATLSVVKDLGYRPVFWSFAYRDWLTDDQPEPEWALQKVVGQLHDGSIILLHAVSETNVAILGRFIDEAINQGYSFASMKELQ